MFRVQPGSTQCLKKRHCAPGGRACPEACLQQVGLVPPAPDPQKTTRSTGCPEPADAGGTCVSLSRYPSPLPDSGPLLPAVPQHLPSELPYLLTKRHHSLCQGDQKQEDFLQLVLVRTDSFNPSAITKINHVQDLSPDSINKPKPFPSFPFTLGREQSKTRRPTPTPSSSSSTSRGGT